MQEEEPYEVYVKLIEILEPFSEKKIVIPGTNLYIRDFLLKLKKQVNDLKKKLSEKHKIESVINKLQMAKELVKELKEKAIEIDKLNAFSSSINISYLKTLKKSIEKELENYAAELAKIKEEYDHVDKRIKDDPNRLLRNFAELEQEYISIKERLSEIEQNITESLYAYKIRKKELEKLNAQRQPPKYFKKLKKLEECKIKLMKIRQKINDAKKLLEKLSRFEKNFENTELSNQEKKFYDGLSEYLANILGKLYFIDRWYELEKVDVINSQFIVKGRNYPIGFEDLSTGRSQTTSLITQLRQDVGKKLKIVLFDEVQVMDKNSLKMVLNELKSQAKEGRLLLAIIARVDDTIKTPIMEKIW